MELNRESILREIATSFNVEQSSLTEETKFKDDLKADSIDLFQMLVEYEEKLNITIDDEELANIKTVGDLLAAIIK